MTGRGMDKFKKSRAVVRTSFTKIYNGMLEAIKMKEPDLIEIQENLGLLQQKIEALAELNRQVFDLLVASEATVEEELIAEVQSGDEYISKYNKMKIEVNQILNRNTLEELRSSTEKSSTNNLKKFKLPSIEFKRFNGDIKEWLPFWSQFKRIHQDDDIDPEDKFQYLLQATIPKSRARQLVESYPPTADNYPNVIESLKSRFGRDDLLVEVYIRELLKLILNNLDDKIELSTLYDKIECHLRALETLKVTTDKCAAMLYPLVESCLPEELLRTWQRSSFYDSESTPNMRLDNLMKFLKREVENEERISLAISGFDIHSNAKVKKKRETVHKQESVPTAADLINNNKTQSPTKCIFCEAPHRNENCLKARQWSFSEETEVLKKKGCCFVCTKFGHLATRCRVKLKCIECQGRHVSIMCPKLSEIPESSDNKKTSNELPRENTLSKNTYAEVFLQTLIVQVKGEKIQRRARAIIDTGSQRSYIMQKTAIEMEYCSIGQEKMIHALFGGGQSEICTHQRYRIRLYNLDDSYACNFEVLDQPLICQDVSFVREGSWTKELKKLGIQITDSADQIEILIGADVAGKIFTGKRHLLACGLVAVETLLGWTLMGKVALQQQQSCSMFVTSLFSKELLTK